MSKKGIKVTERNMMMVMGKINKFLQKPTVLEYGPEAQAVNAYCEESAIRHRLRKGKTGFSDIDRKLMYEDALLQIVDTGLLGSILIERGSHVFITGSYMVLECNDTVRRTWNSEEQRVKNYLLGGKNSVYVFKHVPVEEGQGIERIRNIMRNVYSAASESECLIDSSDIPFEDTWTFNKYCSDIYESVMELIENIEESSSSVKQTFVIGGAGREVFIVIYMNIDINRNGRPVYGEESLQFRYKGETFATTTELIFYIMEYQGE